MAALEVMGFFLWIAYFSGGGKKLCHLNSGDISLSINHRALVSLFPGSDLEDSCFTG